MSHEKGKKEQQQNCPDPQDQELSRAFQVIVLNRRILSCVGLWPLRVMDPLFCYIFIYAIIHTVLSLMDLVNVIRNFELVLDNLTETVLIVMVLGKLCISRLSIKAMMQFLLDIREDYMAKTYETAEEKVAFLRYIGIATKFIKISTFLAGIAASAFYLRAFPANAALASSRENSSFEYVLPYRIHPIIKIEDTTTLYMVLLFHSTAVLCVIVGRTGVDAFCVSMTLHVCGQLAALSTRVKYAFTDAQGPHHGISKLVRRHNHLIRLADTLEECYSNMILQHVLGTIFLLCLTGFDAIKNTDESGNVSAILIFILYAATTTSTDLVYCYVGECLMDESTRLCDELYNCEWYNMQVTHQRLAHIIMVRSQRPIALKAGQFCILSLATFTIIVKTAVGYLSVLRTLT